MIGAHMGRNHRTLSLRCVGATALLLALLAPVSGQGVDLAIVGGTVICRSDAEPLAGHTVLISGGRIRAVVPDGSVVLPPGTALIDASHRWVIPGLFDAHVHLSSTQTPWGTVVEETQKLLDGFLLNGVTSVLDLWSTDEIFALRELERRSRIISPRLFASGSGLSAPGSYGTHFGHVMARITTGEEASARIVELKARGADVIKVAQDVLTRDGQRTTSFSRKTFRAITDAAHARGLKVVAHALPAFLADQVVEDGADVLAHIFTGRRAAPTVVARIKERGVVVIPCLVVEEPFLRLRDEPEFLTEPRLVNSVDPRVLNLFKARGQRRLAGTMFARSARTFPVAFRNATALISAGCNVVAGSDAGNLAVFHGPGLHREAELLHKAGMSPARVLEALTVGGARIVGREKEQGTLAPGKVADLVVLDGDPLVDVRNLRRVAHVVKSGRVIDLERLRRRIRTTHLLTLPAATFATFDAGAVTASGSQFFAVRETGRPPHSSLAFGIREEDERSFLRMEGKVAQWPYAFVGVSAHLQPLALGAVNLKATPMIEFHVRGTAGTGLLEVMTLDCGQGAFQRAFRVTPAWTRVLMDLRRLRPDSIPGNARLDPARMMTLRILTGARRSGAFRMDLDQIRFLPVRSKD